MGGYNTKFSMSFCPNIYKVFFPIPEVTILHEVVSNMIALCCSFFLTQACTGDGEWRKDIRDTHAYEYVKKGMVRNHNSHRFFFIFFK